MQNPIKKMMQSKYKYCFVAIIIMAIVFILGAVFVMSMSSTIADHHVDYTDFTVVDKYTGDNHSYIIVSDQNESFDLPNDNFGKDVYNDIQVGRHYKFITETDNNSITTHIIQVHNDTN